MTNRKPLIGLFAACFFLLSSCTEKILLETVASGEVIKDTTYIGEIESQNQRKVLVEEATGVDCPSCPDGAKVLKDIEKLYPGRLVTVGLHAFELTRPLKESKYDFRTPFAEYLFTKYFENPSAKPAAVFDRTKQTDSTYFATSRVRWQTIASKRMDVPAPLNLRIQSTYNSTGDSSTFIVTVTGAYTSAVNNKQNLTVMITENNIVDAQKGENAVLIPEYTHMHVLRDMLTQITGDPILNSVASVEPGRVFIKSFEYKLPEKSENWDIDHLHIVAFIHNESDKEVQQAETIKLKP